MIKPTKYIKAYLLVFIWLLLSYGVWAQALKPKIERERYYKFEQLNLRTGLRQIDFGRPITSLVVEISATASFSGSYVLLDDRDTIWLGQELGDYAESRIDIQRTPLIILPRPSRSIRLFNNQLNKVAFHTMDAGRSDEELRKLKKMAAVDSCDPPAFILPQEWRKDLPDPKKGRSQTEVRHIIIHHSATNLSDNYVNDVRNIYLYHTETNGWDDIGYNFLVAPDGSVFLGRDPESFEPDEVQGAHFCAKNTGTMGICMMGNFTNSVPTDTAFGSLVRLCAWKMKKIGVFPYQQEEHPKSSARSIELNRIAGHKDGHKSGVWEGCATACPGNKLYARLDGVRNVVLNRLERCGLVSGVFDEKSGSVKVYPQPAHDFLHIDFGQNSVKEQPAVLDIRGREYHCLSYAQDHRLVLDVSSLAVGTYILVFRDDDQPRRLRFMKQ